MSLSLSLLLLPRNWVLVGFPVSVAIALDVTVANNSSASLVVILAILFILFACGKVLVVCDA